MRECHAEPQRIVMHPNPKFRHCFLFGGVVVLTLCLSLFLSCESVSAQPADEDTVPLSVSLAPGAHEDAVLSPPPGEYRIPRGDVVVVRAQRPAAPAGLPEWTGGATGTARETAVLMDGPRRLSASFSAAPPSGVDRSFAAPEKGAMHAFVGSGGLYGWFSVDRHKDNTGAGITQLVSADEPFCPVFTRPNLNFEHIMNGCRDDQWRAEDTPRTDPMQVRLLSPSSVEVRWPAEGSAWKLDCVMRYTFTGRNAVDMEFEVTPRAEEAPRGFLIFMWASYMHMARERTIHFPGVRDGAAGWTAFGKEGESGTVSGEGQAPLQWDSNAGVMNLNPAEGVYFREPVYYGLVDGDQNMDTADDAMAFIMMFDEPASTRFAVWNWGDSPYCSAWDWQFVLRSPEVGRTYRQRARMVYKRFAGEDDVLAEYRRWSDASGNATREGPLPMEAFPLVLSPGQDRQDPIQLGAALLAADPAGAVRLYREALRNAVSRTLAASLIDGVYTKRGDFSGLTAFWTSVTQERPADGEAWYRLGLAQESEGHPDRAAAAHGEALRLNPDRQQARLRLGGLSAAAGDVQEGLQLVNNAVAAAPELEGAAADICRKAAEKRVAAGDLPGALSLLGRAHTLSPKDLQYRIALGGALETAGDDQGALAEYRAVVTADVPESARSGERIDAIYQRRNDIKARVDEWKSLVSSKPEAAVPQLHLGMALEAFGDGAGAETAYREALRLRPERMEPKLRLGALLAAGGDVAGGLPMIDEAVSVMPDLAGPAAEACERAAKCRLSAGDPAGAVALLRRARSLSPTDLRFRVALGGAFEAAGDDAGALGEYRAVVAEAPDAPHSSARMDAVLQRRNDPAARLAEWKGVVQAHPNEAVPKLYLGRALEVLGDTAGAETAYREALQLDPEQLEAKAMLGAVIAAGGGVEGGLRTLDEAVLAVPGLAGPAAEACERAAQTRLSGGDHAGALTLLRRARSLSPTDLRYRVSLGGALEAAGDDAAALEEYRAVVGEVPESPHSSARIDAIYGRRKDSSGRVAEWRRAVAAHPGAATPRLHLGLALEASGDEAGAESAYREALSRDAALEAESALFGRVKGAGRSAP